MSVISASEFRKRATRVIEIDGFEPGEKIEVRIKPASLINLMVSGKLPNNLLATVQELFNEGPDTKPNDVFAQGADKVKEVLGLLDLVCEQSLVEPTFEEIKDVITDAQKMQIMTEAQGNVKAAIPSIPKQENLERD